MLFRDLLWWIWYSLKRRIRGEKVPDDVRKVCRQWRQEDEACEGKKTPVEIRIWKESDAHGVNQLPPGPAHMPFGVHDFWNYFSQQGTVGLVAVQARKIVGVLVMWEMTIVRFAVAGHCRNEGIGTRLLEFLRVLVSPLPQMPIMAEVAEENLAAHKAFKKAEFVATTIQRNQPEPGKSLHIFECPPHIGWKKGVIRIVDGDQVTKLIARQLEPANQ